MKKQYCFRWEEMRHTTVVCHPTIGLALVNVDEELVNRANKAYIEFINAENALKAAVQEEMNKGRVERKSPTSRPLK